MIRVTVGNNLSRKNVTIEDETATTLKSVLEENQIDYTRFSVNLDGATLQPGDLEKTFADFGITNSCFLLAVTKMDNA